MRRGSKRNVIIVLLLIMVLGFMGIGYAAFRTNLKITGVASTTDTWNISIINAEVLNVGGSAENVSNTYNNLTASLEANLYNKGDYVEYKITVENKGTLDAKLENIVGLVDDENSAVKVTSGGITKGQALNGGQTLAFTIKVEYNNSYGADASGTSGETNVMLSFVQNKG